MSHRLRQRGRPHLVLERHRIAERWKSERWEGLRFQFPNWSVRLPDFEFPHDDPDGFAALADIVAFIDAYAAFVAPPIRSSVAVTALRKHGDGFRAETAQGPIDADNVVVATGPYQRALVPDLLAASAIFQVHANGYRTPDQLPAGAVLVVGAGASGAQIAEELLQAGRRVFLSVGQHRRMPRRYRGRDIIWWLAEMGLDRVPVEERGPTGPQPLITGAAGGYTIDFRDLAARGMALLGRTQGARGDTLFFADDLRASLPEGDASFAGFLDLVDDYAVRKGLDVPPEPAARARLATAVPLGEPIRQLDLRAAGIGAVVWATGYGFDFRWIDLPVFNAGGAPRHRHGVSDVAGLYFLGLPFLSRMSSSFLSGVGDDAARLADHIVARSPQVTAGGAPSR
jgi:putative flavoprotein involved in K+ transport